MQEQIGTQVQKVQTVVPGEGSAPDVSGDSVVRPNVRDSASPVVVNEYTELKRLIKQKGLQEKQPGYYTYKILLKIGLLVVGLVFLLVVNNFWLQLLNATYLGFVLT